MQLRTNKKKNQSRLGREARGDDWRSCTKDQRVPKKDDGHEPKPTQKTEVHKKKKQKK